MGYLDGFTAALFRDDGRGGKVYAPFGSMSGAYQVTPDDMIRIAGQAKLAYALMLVATLVIGTMLGWRWNVWLTVPLFTLSYCVLAYWQTRRLVRSAVSVKELPAVTRREMFTRQSKAFGSRILAIMVVVNIAFVLIGVWMLVETGGREAWMVTGFFGFCLIVSVLQWRQSRGDDAGK